MMPTAAVRNIAPVEKFDCDFDGTSASLVGYAAPAGGPNPCMVKLVAGTTILSVTKATRLSETASALNLRYGWCGFGLSGLHQAAAFEGDVLVQCALTDKTLYPVPRDKIIAKLESSGSAKRPVLTAIDLLRAISSVNGTADSSYIMPFVKHTLEDLQPLEIVEILYRYVLRRPLDDSGRQTWVEAVKNGMKMENLFQTLWDATADKTGRRSVLQGPFEPGFVLNRDLLT